MLSLSFSRGAKDIALSRKHLQKEECHSSWFWTMHPANHSEASWHEHNPKCPIASDAKAAAESKGTVLTQSRLAV